MQRILNEGRQNFTWTKWKDSVLVDKTRAYFGFGTTYGQKKVHLSGHIIKDRLLTWKAKSLIDLGTDLNNVL